MNVKELMNKPANQLTVADSFKIQGVLLAVMAGGAIVVAGTVVGIDELNRWNHNRKSKKNAPVVEL